MFFWHVAATTAIARYSFRDDNMDLRFLALGALLPDLIDTPIGLIAYNRFEAVRLFGHSLLFAAIVMTWIVLATRRGRPRKKWMPVAIGILIHLFLDAMWANPETLWWPVLGSTFSSGGAASVGDYVSSVMRSPWVWAGEAVGIAYMVVLAKRGGLAQRGARHELIRTGRLNVPIGSSGP